MLKNPVLKDYARQPEPEPEREGSPLPVEKVTDTRTDRPTIGAEAVGRAAAVGNGVTGRRAPRASLSGR